MLLCGSVREKLPLCFLICLQFKLSAWGALRWKRARDEDEDERKTGWAHVACESVRAGTSPCFCTSHISQKSVLSAHEGCGRWMFLTVGWKRFACTKTPTEIFTGNPESQPTFRSEASEESRFNSMVTVRTTVQDVSLLFCCSASWDRTSIAVPGSPRGGWGISAGLSLQSWELIK